MYAGVVICFRSVAKVGLKFVARVVAPLQGRVMRHVALLRGLNVGAHNRIRMPELVEVFVDAGARDVTTFIQSGNVLFTASASTCAKVATKAQALLDERHEVKSPVVLRSDAELTAVLKRNPFLKKKAAPEALHVAFLADQPTTEAAASLDPKRSPTDAFALQGRDLFLHCPNGLARTKLTNAYFDSKLKTVSTVRNWNTVQQLAELLAG
jgi:uncharacterized protein (DUF1697 family)